MKALLYIIDENRAVRTAIVPDSAVTRSVNPFFPPLDGRWTGIVMRGVRIDRLGKGIDAAFADRYYTDAVTAVHTVCADDNGQDLAFALGRDGALIICDPVVGAELTPEYKPLIDNIISHFSNQITLKTGDLVLVGRTDGAVELPSPPANVIVDADGPFPGFRLKIR